MGDVKTSLKFFRPTNTGLLNPSAVDCMLIKTEKNNGKIRSANNMITTGNVKT
jgi:hypothetical protein